MTVSVKPNQGGDFAIHLESTQYCLLSLPVENAGAAAVDLKQVAGMPVIIDAGQTKATLLEVGQVGRDEADVNGFLLEGPAQDQLAAAGITPEQYAVVWSGPAVLNQDKIPAADAAGNAITAANVVAGATANMEDVRFATEPEKLTEQTPDTGV